MKYQSPKGIVLILPLLIMGMVSVAALVLLSQTGIESIAGSYEQRQALETRTALFGCLDEVFIQLSADPAWNNPTVYTNAATCTVALSAPAPGQTSALVTLTSGDIVRGVKAVITLSPVILIESIEETLTP